MAAKRGQGDPVVTRLDAVLAVLQNLLILEGAQAGIRKEDLRRIMAIDSRRISSIMKHVRQSKRSKE